MVQPGTFGVLVAEDDAGFRETVVEVLRAEGHRVTVARDGEAALCALREASEPLVVLLDYRMPRMDGLDVLRAMAADGQERSVRHVVLLMTAADDPQLTSEASDVAPLITAMLPKPFDLDELEAAIELAATRLVVRTRTQ